MAAMLLARLVPFLHHLGGILQQAKPAAAIDTPVHACPLRKTTEHLCVKLYDEPQTGVEDEEDKKKKKRKKKKTIITSNTIRTALAPRLHVTTRNQDRQASSRQASSKQLTDQYLQ
ncbi:uncharacterized protein PG986_005820 [Apiospora aurea]|uniref:Secreted protein n=1 Tax=Apiospora aurea TaxID=335848 RepID=A0ABR1QIN6_9PEZI